MAQQGGITVRRAKPSDAGKIAAFVNAAWGGQRKVDETAVIERFGSVGFVLALQGDALVGMLGWRAENLIVRLTDFLLGHTADRLAAGRALLDHMDQAARELECEAALLFLPRQTPSALLEFYQTLGYGPQLVSELPKAWQEAAREGGLRDDETVMVKKLREKRVLRPI